MITVFEAAPSTSLTKFCLWSVASCPASSPLLIHRSTSAAALAKSMRGIICSVYAYFIQNDWGKKQRSRLIPGNTTRNRNKMLVWNSPVRHLIHQVCTSSIGKSFGCFHSSCELCPNYGSRAYLSAILYFTKRPNINGWCHDGSTSSQNVEDLQQQGMIKMDHTREKNNFILGHFLQRETYD